MQDITGKNSDSLKEKTLYLLDMDGTIYNENEIFEGTLDFLSEIRKRGGEFIFIMLMAAEAAMQMRRLALCLTQKKTRWLSQKADCVGNLYI